MLAPGSETRLIIDGPAGGLQALVTVPEGYDPKKQPVTIACHPHSQMGGTMNNKVVYTLMRARRNQGHVVVRFNFRGVEGSEGAFAQGQGEQEDLLAVVRWVHQQWPEAVLCLSGFSFGAYVAAASCNQLLAEGFAISHLLLIAPAVENYSFDELLAFACPLSMVYGDQDEVVASSAIAAWFDRVNSAKQVWCLEGAGHFFHGRLVELRALIEGDKSCP